MRAIAILPVVFYHADMPAVTGGFVGVDVFFVISGFLITGVLRDDLNAGRFSLVGFYERRARRILPALITVILACFAGAAVLATPAAFTDFAKSAAATALFTSNFWFWWSSLDYFASAAGIEPLLHTWSLAVEEQFYIAFPLMLWALFSQPRPILISAVVGTCLLSLALAVWGTGAVPAAAFYLAPTRAWELGLGVLLALGVFPVCGQNWLREVAAAAGLAAIFAAVLLFDADTPFPGFAALLPCVGATTLIWSGIPGPTRITTLLSLRPIVFIGLISYSLYLWHWSILVFLRLYLGTVTLTHSVAMAALAASFAFAMVSWACIEQPFRRRPPIGFRRPTIFAASAGTLTLVLLLATWVWRTGGVPQRLAPEAQLALSVAEEGFEFAKGCNDRIPESGLCRFGANAGTEAPADFLLWGDSHAVAILPGVDVAAREAGRSGLFAAKGACPPLLGLERADRRGHHCAEFNAAVLTVLRARDDIPIVILAARWALAAEGTRAPGESGRLPLLERDGEEPASNNPAGNFVLFHEALAKTVAAIRAAGREVILVEGVPEIGWNVPIELFRHFQFHVSLPLPPTWEETTKRNRRADQVLTELAVDPGVHLLPVVSRLCDPICRIIADGRPLYRDEHHLSSFGAVTVIAPLLAEKIWPKRMD